MKKSYLIVLSVIFLGLVFITVISYPTIDGSLNSMLASSPAFKAPARLIDVKAVQVDRTIDVQLVNITAANLRNVKVTIFLPESDNISYHNDAVTAFGSYLIRDDFEVFKPDQVQTYRIDLNKLYVGVPDKIRIFFAGYYSYVLAWTHFMSDQPLLSDNLKLFSSQEYHVSLQYPSSWKQSGLYSTLMYEGSDGFFELSALDGAGWTIDQAAELEVHHILKPFGAKPSIKKMEIAGQEARLIKPSADQ